MYLLITFTNDEVSGRPYVMFRILEGIGREYGEIEAICRESLAPFVSRSYMVGRWCDVVRAGLQLVGDDPLDGGCAYGTGRPHSSFCHLPLRLFETRPQEHPSNMSDGGKGLSAGFPDAEELYDNSYYDLSGHRASQLPYPKAGPGCSLPWNRRRTAFGELALLYAAIGNPSPGTAIG